MSSERELATALAAASTKEARQALLETEKELLTVKLAQELLRQGSLLINQGKYQVALDILSLTIDLTNRLPDRREMATALESIGAVHFFQGNFAQALEEFQRCLPIREEVGTKEEISRALNNIGSVYAKQSNYTQALEYYQKSLKIAEEIGDKSAISRALVNIGNVYNEQANPTQALAYYQKSLNLAEEAGDKEGMSIALTNIGNVYNSQANYTQALEYHQKSLQIIQQTGNQYVIVRALNSIGLVYRLQGNYTEALEYHQKSLKLAEAIGDKSAIADALNDMGTVYRLQNNYAQALEYHQRSLQADMETGLQEGTPQTLNNIGTVYRLQGNYTQALEAFQRNLKISEELGDKFGVAFTLNNLGNLYNSQGSPTQAIELANRAADIAGQIGSPDVLWRAQTTAGKASLALNRPDQARLAFDSAITAIEGLRTQVAGSEQDRQRFFEDKLSPYHQMVQLLIGQNNLDKAFDYAEQAKARVLLEVLESGRVNLSQAMTGEEQQQERELNNRLASLNIQITRAQANAARLTDLKAQRQKVRLEHEAFQTSLYATHPELRLKRGQVEIVKLADAASLLPDTGSALLEYVVTEDKTFLFVLTKRIASQPAPDVKVYTIEMKQRDLATRAESFRRQLAEHDLDFQEAAARLYDLLLKPAQAQIAGKTNLLIIPDETLWQLPFQALQPAPGRYLLEDAAVAYAPSLTVLREMRRRQQKANPGAATSPSLLAVGNPTIGKGQAERLRLGRRDERLDSLPEAEVEVKNLARLYGPEHSRVYIQAEAKEGRLKAEAGRYDILHLATHAILNDASPMYSHIVLSQVEGDDKEDGLLEAWEVMNLNLQAHLVVLSACETARGRVGAGEGVIGLMWAFFVAGCPTTVVSQWKVDSASTTDLMVEFHRNLQGSKGTAPSAMTKAEALRQAAIKLLKQNNYHHPLYWAGFIIVGDGR